MEGEWEEEDDGGLAVISRDFFKSGGNKIIGAKNVKIGAKILGVI